MCSTGNHRSVNAQKQCGQKNMTAHAKNRCSSYVNKGKCSQRERCYPSVISSEYLVKSNNGIFVRKCECLYLRNTVFINFFYVYNEMIVLAIDVKMYRCSCTQKHGKLLELTINPERKFPYKCRWCTSISRHSCLRPKSNYGRRKMCVRVPFSQDAMTDLWNVERVCEGLHCVRSQDNDFSRSSAKKNGQFQEESTNVEKLTQEETTSSSYIDAKNCFVQDACIQTVCVDRKETCLERFSDQCEKEKEENTILPKDLSFTYYEYNETKLEDKHEQTSLNCDCELPLEKEPMNSVDVETSISLEQVQKSNINEMQSVSDNCTCIPYVPELRLERKCDCHLAFNSKYQFVERRFDEYKIESHPKYDETCQTSRLYDTRNHWNSEITSLSSCESNRCTSNDLRSSTSTESINPPRAKTKIMCINRDQRPLLFLDKSIKIGEGPWRRNDEMILKNSTSPLIHNINTKDDYSDQSNQFTCHCDDTDQKVISDDKFEYVETGHSKTSYSSTSLSSYDHDRSPRPFSRFSNCRCRNLVAVASSASICTESLASEIEYGHVKESSKGLNPLSLKSTITYGSNRNSRLYNTKFYSQRTLSIMRRRWKENYERAMNDLCD